MCGNAGKGNVNSLELCFLPDGRIRIDTGDFSGAAHVTADKFLLELQRELGATLESRTPLARNAVHVHDHAHDAIKAGSGGHGHD